MTPQQIKEVAEKYAKETWGKINAANRATIAAVEKHNERVDAKQEASVIAFIAGANFVISQSVPKTSITTEKLDQIKIKIDDILASETSEFLNKYIEKTSDRISNEMIVELKKQLSVSPDGLKEDLI